MCIMYIVDIYLCCEKNTPVSNNKGCSHDLFHIKTSFQYGSNQLKITIYARHSHNDKTHWHSVPWLEHVCICIYVGALHTYIHILTTIYDHRMYTHVCVYAQEYTGMTLTAC